MTLAIDDNAIRYIYERLVGRRCGLVYNSDNRIEIVKLPIGHTVNRDALSHRERAIYDCLEGYGMVTREEMVIMFNKILDYVDTAHKTGALPQIAQTPAPVPVTTIVGASLSAPTQVASHQAPVPMHCEYTIFAQGVHIGGTDGAPVAGTTFFAPGVRLAPGDKLVSVMISSDSSAATAYGVEVTERTTAAHHSIYAFNPDESGSGAGDTISREIPIDYAVGENPALFVFLVAPAPKDKDGRLLEMAMQVVVRRALPAPEPTAK